MRKKIHTFIFINIRIHSYLTAFQIMDFHKLSYLFIFYFLTGKNVPPLQVKYFFYKSGNNSKSDVSRTSSNCNETSNPGLVRPLSIALIIAVEQPTNFPHCACVSCLAFLAAIIRSRLTPFTFLNSSEGNGFLRFFLRLGFIMLHPKLLTSP